MRSRKMNKKAISVTHSGGKNMKYYNIDENIACTAHGMVHMSDYVLNKGGCNA